MENDALPRTAALDGANGPRPNLRLTQRSGRIVTVYAKARKAKVVLDSGEQRILDFTPILIPPWPNMPEGTRVVVGYIRGDPWSPYIVGAVDPGVEGQSLVTKPPYNLNDAGAKIDPKNLLVWEFIHRIANETGQDAKRVYANLTSWLRFTADGSMRFTHLQSLPNPNEPDTAGLITRKHFYLDLSASDKLSLAWPFSGGSKARVLSHEVTGAGSFKSSLALTGGTEAAPATLEITADQHLHLAVKDLAVDYDGSKFSLTRGATVVEVKGDAVTLRTTGFTLQVHQNGKLDIQASGAVSLDAAQLLVSAGKVDIDSHAVRLGKMSRQVAYKGSKVAPHTHKYYVAGVQHTTSAVGSTIQDGAAELKV